MKKIKNVFITLVAVVFFVLPGLVLAQSTQSNGMLDRLKVIGGNAGYETDQTKASTPIIVGIVIQAFLGFLGITFIILVIMAGIKWMTANGNEDEVKKAVRIIKESIIGLIVVLISWTMWDFVFKKLILGQ